MEEAKDALENKTPVSLRMPINNLDRTTGTILSYNISTRCVRASESLGRPAGRPAGLSKREREWMEHGGRRLWSGSVRLFLLEIDGVIVELTPSDLLFCLFWMVFLCVEIIF